MAAASAVALLGGTTGVAAAAQGALPGEALYPVKRGIERADAALNVNSGARGRDLLEQAGSRLSEAERLLEGEPESTALQIREVLADFEEQSAEGVGLLLTAFEQEEDRAAVVEVRAFAAEGSERLGSMAPVVPPEAEGELTSAALLLHGIDARAAALCPGCGEEQPVLQLPEVLSDVLPARVEVARVVPRGAGRRQDDSRRLESRGRAAKDPATRARRQHTGAADHAGTTPADPGPQPSATQPPGRRQAEPGTRPAGGGQPGVVPRAPTEVDVPGSDGGTPASGVPSVPDLPPVVEDLTEDLTDDVGTVLPDPVPAPAELLD